MRQGNRSEYFRWHRKGTTPQHDAVYKCRGCGVEFEFRRDGTPEQGTCRMLFDPGALIAIHKCQRVQGDFSLGDFVRCIEVPSDAPKPPCPHCGRDACVWHLTGTCSLDGDPDEQARMRARMAGMSGTPYR